ncbi:MAG: hypothetical protein L0332_17875 [Chloroflexi bacterium]|nr:hypothetical protein [Chloroflexota bacterium]
MITVIAYHPMGYEIRIEAESDKLDTTVRWLEKHGYRPNRDIQYTPEGLPICPRHGVPMEKREKQGDEWFSHKVTDPQTGQAVYCRGYASPSSPGWNVEPAGRAAEETPPTPPARASQVVQPTHPAEAQTATPATAGASSNGRRSIRDVNDDLFGG